MQRFTPILLIALLVLAQAVHTAPKMVILGIDGMDPRLMQEYMDEGVMPHFERLSREGDFKPLQTTMSPQSPVAWSSFITGMDPGGHGIFDFVHRDPTTSTPLPISSMAKTEPGWNLEVGTWVIPLSGGAIRMLRHGRAFWEVLSDHDIPSVVYRMPVNFPPVEHSGFSLSGMGTPDILGSPGTFSFFTENLPDNADDFTGGKAYLVQVDDGVVEAELIGPENPLRRFPEELSRYERMRGREPRYIHPDMTRPFTVFIDDEAGAALFDVGGHEFILQEGEWSDWVEVYFDAIPYAVSVSAIGRFYLKQLQPDFQLYVSPLQINPADPAMPITNPEAWSKELCDCLGFFYTQEMPEDTKALTYGVFTGRDFWEQAMYVNDEGRRALDYLLPRHEQGLLFFYFGSVDQISHMLWRYMDERHPGYIDDEFLKNGIRRIYESMDDVLGQVMAAIDEETTLIVMSDHGFGPFYWGVNLNTWLFEKGYIGLNDERNLGRRFSGMPFEHVDWSETTAYSVGLNGVYINLEGRERSGIVSPDDYDEIVDQLKADLLEMRDPRNGRQVVTKVTIPRRDFTGERREDGPDLIVGYNWGYRSSWESPLGEMTREVFVDNMDAWSGDHCGDNDLVPGVLLTNQRITIEDPALHDLTVGVLSLFGVDPLRNMTGRNCLAPRNEARPVALDGE